MQTSELFDGTTAVCPQREKSFGGRIRIGAVLETADLGASRVGQELTIAGWVKTTRKQGGGGFAFVAINDGSTIKNMQVIVPSETKDFDKISKLGPGCAVRVHGLLVESPASGQAVEMRVDDNESHRFEIIGDADNRTYPLAKKGHSREYLREIAHLRPRSFLIGAVARIRSQLCMATHQFFQDLGFLYVHTPLITAADCEGAGEMFQVSTILEDKAEQIPRDSSGLVDYKKDFFGKPAFLTVSGQLSVENFCCALSDVYTFGPTFRAEKSYTSRHLAEFWMIEPEIAFADIFDNMSLAEACLKYLVKWVLNNCRSDLDWCEKNNEEGLIARLQDIVDKDFVRMTYTDAIEALKTCGAEFENSDIQWGMDLGSEHERYLAEKLYNGPVILYNYPKDIKAFYMRGNDDGRTVAAMDVLLPKVGEVIGGSQREERLDRLESAMKAKDLDLKPYWWYFDLRRYGTIPHAGFGLGLERLVMLAAGVDNIRDVIPFPRYPGHADF